MNLSNESKLLLYCAQAEISEVLRDKVTRLIKLPINWEDVLESASWHGIVPLLYNNLKGIQERHVIPEEVMDRLKSTYHGNLARNMYLYTELKRVLEVFLERGVEVIILKGAALAKTVYGDIGLRPMCDIDLLVRKEDLTNVEDIMTGLDYPFKDNNPAERYGEDNHHTRFFNQENNVLIEIHWHISCNTHPTRIRNIDSDIIEMWWEGAKAIEISGVKSLMLCPEDLIIHLCLHFIKHRFLGGFNYECALIQVCDIYQVLKQYRDEIDWVSLKCKTGKYGIERHVYTTLTLVMEITGKYNGISNNVLSAIKSECLDKELVEIMKKRILIGKDVPNAAPGPFVQSHKADTLTGKIKIILREIFPSPEVISERYSVPLTSRRLYYYYVSRLLNFPIKHRKIMLEMPRVKEDLILKKWISGKD